MARRKRDQALSHISKLLICCVGRRCWKSCWRLRRDGSLEFWMMEFPLRSGSRWGGVWEEEREIKELTSSNGPECRA